MNLSMKQRLLASFTVILGLMVLISLIGAERVGVINANMTDVATGATLKQRYAINFRGSVHDRAISIRDAVLVSNDTELSKHLADVKRLDGFYQDSAAPMKALLSRADATAEEKKLAEVINNIEVDTQAATAKLIELRQKGEIEKAQQMLLNEVSGKYSAWLKAINNFIDYQEAAIKGKVGEVESIASGFATLMIIISLLAIALGAYLAFNMIRYVQKTLGAEPDQLKAYAQSLAQGDFKPSAADHASTDMGSVLAELKQVKANSKSAIDQVDCVIESISKGDFNQRITANLQGDWDSMKRKVNESADQIETVMMEMVQFWRHLEAGRFEARTVNAPGEFGNLMRSAKSSMDALNSVMSDVKKAMIQLSEGELSVRITADAKGDLNDIKTTFNHSLDMIDHLIDDLLAMAKAQIEGDLTKVSHGDYKGKFKQLQDARAESTARIVEVITHSVDASNVVSHASSQLSQGAHDLSSRVQEQASSLEQVGATMHAMTQAVSDNTQSAAKVADLTHHVQSQSDDGMKVMKETIKSISQMRPKK